MSRNIKTLYGLTYSQCQQKDNTSHITIQGIIYTALSVLATFIGTWAMYFALAPIK